MQRALQRLRVLDPFEVRLIGVRRDVSRGAPPTTPGIEIVGADQIHEALAAADAVHVEALDRKGLLTPGSRASFAIGVLALWVPPHSKAAVSSLEDLASPEVHVIAVAKPALAPYGQASIDALTYAGVLEKVKPKIVYAENINMAKQYGMSGNADAVFTAYSLVLHEGGKVLQVDDRFHQPLVQELAIIAKSPHQDTARKFVDFLRGDSGRETLRSFGYH